MVKGARKPFDWGKLYLPLGCLFLILTPFYITLFMYSWIDSIWPFRACPGYWAFCVLVQFIIFTLVPFLTFGILGVYLCQKPRFAKVSDVNAVQSAANPVFYIKAVLYILAFLVLIFFLACLITLTVLVAVYHGTTIPQQNSDVSGLSGVQAATGILLVRDPNSVLHVQASNTFDVAYGLGFAHSQDRFYQMDLYRRIAMGWLAEIDTQPSALQSDKFFRTIGLNQTATDNYSLLSLDAKNWLLAYARGVNDYIGTKAAYPFEFYIKQYNGFARPWQPIHSLAILKLVQFLWSGNANQELLRTYLLFDQQLSFDRISELLPPYPIDGFSTFNPTDLDIPSALVQTYIAREKTRIAGEGTIVNALQSAFSVTPKASPPTTAAGITHRSLEELVSLWDGSVGAVRDVASMVSNAAATATFILHGSSISPMMGTSAQDSHKLMAPTLYYMANLKRVAQLSTDTNDEAVGATIPGIPGMFMGRALSYVYSVAPMYADTMDWFVMQETSDKMTYITNAGVQNYTRRTEVINVLNGAPVTITVRTSEFGPIMSDVFQTPINANTQQLSLALQWTGHYKTSTVADNTIEWLMKSWTAKTTSDTSLVATFSNYTSSYLNVPAMNVFYADRIDGVGRYVGAGRIPSRTTGHTGMFPVKGDRSIQWTGFHPNPVSSIRLILKPIIANAGNRPIGPGYPTNFGYDFADQYRGRRLYTYFNTITSSGRTVTTDNGVSAVHDKYTSLLDDFKPLITSIRAASFVDSDASNALQNVFNWDGLDQNMATLFQNWYWELTRLSQAETGIQYSNRPEFILNAMLPNRTSLTNNTDVTATISGATQTRNIGLCKLALATLYPSATVPDGQSACTMFALQAFKRAKDRVGTGTYWGNVKSTTFPHYGFHGSPMECTSSRYANRAGNQFTINQGAELPPSGNFASTSGPLYRQFVDYSATGGAVYKWCTPMGSNANLWTKAMYDQYQGYWETETILPMQVSTEFSTSMYQTLRSQSA